MSQLERQLNLPAVVAISVSTMLGSGLFVLPGMAASKTGAAIFLAYLFAGLCVLPAALSKAELATAMPTSGGTYVYLDRTFGPLVGTIAGIGLWLALLLKSAFALVGFSHYLAVLVDVPFKLAAILMLVLIVLINLRGVRKVGQVQSVVVAIAVVMLGVLFVMGLGEYEPRRLEPLFSDGSGGFLAAAAFVFVSYAGITKVTAFAEEVKNPKRNLPLGILLSLLIAVVLYGSVSLILVAVLPMDVLQNDLHPIYTLAETLGGQIFGTIAAVVGVATMASMANGGLLAASRFPYAMSRDRLLPSSLSYLHKEYLTPVVATLLSAGTVAAAVLFIDIGNIAKIASAFGIIIFMGVCVTVIVLREVGPKWYRPPYRSPLYPFTQVVGILACALLLVVLGPVGLLAAIGIAVPGTAIYFLYGRSRAQRKGVISIRGQRKELLKTPTMEMPITSPLDEDARVVVALFGAERTPELLVEHAAALAEGGSVQVVLLSEVPEQTALDAVQDDPKIASIRRRVAAVAEAKEIDLHFSDIASRDIIKTVFDLSNQVHCQWLIMDWGGRSRYSFTFTNPLGWLKSHLPCNLAVYRDVGVRYFRQILVYTEPGPHDALIATTADRLAIEHHAVLTFIRYLPDDATDTEVASEEAYLEQMAQLTRDGANTQVLRGHMEVKTIARFSAGYDLLVTAEPKATIIGQVLGLQQNALTDTVACSVLRLQTPRVETHRALSAVTPTDKIRLNDLLHDKCIHAKIAKQKKDSLFEEFARVFSDAIPELEPEETLAGLWDRERSQNTAVGHGVALPHATLASAKRTYLGIFTTVAPVDYQAPDGEGVSYFFVTIGPPSERQTHLHLLAMVSSLVLKTELLSLLLEANTPQQVIDAVTEARLELRELERSQPSSSPDKDHEEASV
ncbi:MAG: amino acid permease [Kofleriaceae bacterium]|nr:amino acid permease [Kofleriaceae bacterium]